MEKFKNGERSSFTLSNILLVLILFMGFALLVAYLWQTHQSPPLQTPEVWMRGEYRHFYIGEEEYIFVLDLEAVQSGSMYDFNLVGGNGRGGRGIVGSFNSLNRLGINRFNADGDNVVVQIACYEYGQNHVLLVACPPLDEPPNVVESDPQWMTLEDFLNQ